MQGLIGCNVLYMCAVSHCHSFSISLNVSFITLYESLTFHLCKRLELNQLVAFTFQ